MSNNVYGIDLGTNNFKVYSKATGKTMLEKNTIAVIDKIRYMHMETAHMPCMKRRLKQSTSYFLL